MRTFFYILIFILTIVGCSKDESTPTPVTPRRTVMVYFNAHYLSSEAANDLSEIAEGAKSLSDDCNLLVFYDNNSQNSRIYRYTKEGQTTVKNYGTDIDASDPDNMLDILQTMIREYPAPEYVTVFWGHGTGAFVSTTTSAAKSNFLTAYGADKSGTVSTWMNIPEMASVLKQLPRQKMLMFDACMMQSAEVTYELKDYADYIVGPGCETPAFGANYKTLIHVLDVTAAEDLPKAAIDDYCGPNNNWGKSPYDFFNNIVMSAVKTSELDYLLSVTKNVMDTLTHAPILTTTFAKDERNTTNCIYYYKTNTDLDSRYTWEEPIFHDLKDVMRVNLSAKDFATWTAALESAVIYRHVPADISLTGKPSWFGGENSACIMKTNDFRKFYVCEERCGGLSMYIPTNDSNNPMNTDRTKYLWWQRIRK